MFKLNHRALFKLNYVSLSLVRSIRRKNLLDPGVQYRAGLLDVKNIDEYEFEGDFNNLDVVAEEHHAETRRLKRVQEFNIIKQKYFKEKLPNFLNWADKKQIQYLHNVDPDEWSVEKLSDAFPATPEIIKKILKSRYDKNSEKSVKTHDGKVLNNWKLFREGKLDLPRSLKEHLSKFTSREIQMPPSVEIPPKRPLSLKSGEFSSIIKSYESLKGNKNQIESTTNKAMAFIEKKPSSLKNDKKLTTFDQFSKQEEIAKTEQNSNEFATLTTDANAITVKSEELNLKVEKYQKSSSRVSLSQRKYANVMNYPEFIQIPKDKVIRGHTYKLNDCYYDSDGYFLYRVPGMQ